MKNRSYSSQVRLLLNVLPEVAKESCFALHGGTAINLFIRNMPRLSVDIDLTYLPIEDRQTSLNHIAEALKRIKSRIEGILPYVQIQHKSEKGKLFIHSNGVEIKIEVNLVGRGTIHPPNKMMLCDKAQEEYDVSIVIPTVPLGQLYGGKICAALDRQHPRDLFDVKFLLDNEGFSDDVREGFLFCLLSGDRPIYETLAPNLQDQRRAMENQFSGMSKEMFTYDDFENTRERLIKIVQEKLTDKDKQFLLSFKNCDPDWDIYDFERFPAIQWKLKNLRKLKMNNSEKYKKFYNFLIEKLYC